MVDGKDNVLQVESLKVTVMWSKSRDHSAVTSTSTMSDGGPSNVSKNKSHRKEKRLSIASLDVAFKLIILCSLGR